MCDCYNKSKEAVRELFKDENPRAEVLDLEVFIEYRITAKPNPKFGVKITKPYPDKAKFCPYCGEKLER